MATYRTFNQSFHWLDLSGHSIVSFQLLSQKGIDWKCALLITKLTWYQGEPECESRIYSRHMYRCNKCDSDLILNNETDWAFIEANFTSDKGPIKDLYQREREHLLRIVPAFEMDLLIGTHRPMDLDRLISWNLNSKGLDVTTAIV